MTNTPLSNRVLAACVAVFSAPMVMADELNMRVGVTEISKEVYDLHMLILYICCIIGVVVFGAILWSLIHHRKAAGAEPASFHENTKLEILWTLIPLAILVGMAFPATTVLVQMYDTGGEDMTVEVRGYQWKWQYKYLDDDFQESFGFMSNMLTSQDEVYNRSSKGEHYLLDVDKPLVIPTNRKVRFLLTANDVIHAWWVPDFGIKRDAIPGIINELWTIVPEPGIYRGQCTELCGKDHGFMPIVVQVLPEDEYDAWYSDQLVAAEARRAALSKTFTAEELMAEGEAVYTTYCVACHQGNGQGIPPVYPALAGSDKVVGDRDAQIQILMEGVQGTAMQSFASQLDAAQIAAVIHYTRNNWGNNVGDVTQPRDIVEWSEGGQE